MRRFTLISSMLLMVIFSYATAWAGNIDGDLPQDRHIDRSLLPEDGTWVEQASGFSTPSRGIRYVVAVDDNVVWATGYDGANTSNYIVEFTRTTDGGATWTASDIAGYTSNWGNAMIYAVDDMHAWIPVFNTSTGGGDILATTDGGATWVDQSTAAFDGPAGFPNVIHFFDANNGFCQGDPNGGYFELYTTTDGGTNWVRVPQANIPDPVAADEYGTVGYYDAVGSTIWYTTNKGRIFKSTDMGYNWTAYDGGVGINQWKVQFKDDMYGVGLAPITGQVVATTDGGETWATVTPAGSFYTNDYCFVPGTDAAWVSTGAATGLSGASYSLDDGANWTDFTSQIGLQMLAVDFVDNTVGWAGAFNTDASTGGMWKFTGEVAPPPTNLVGGPYTPDANTVLLMHFDGDLTNESTLTADGSINGTGPNSYVDNTGLSLGQALQLDNSDAASVSYVTVPHDTVLSLGDDWTIEGWVKVTSYGAAHTNVPRLVIKPGDPFWQPNYFLEIWSGDQKFSGGFHAPVAGSWPQANSPNGSVVPGEWVHVAYIRDDAKDVLLTMVHNANRELVSYTFQSYDGTTEDPPIFTAQDLHIGYAGGGTDSYLDGVVDEIRVSNIVREFAGIPPIIENVTQLYTPAAGTDQTIEADISTFFDASSVSEAKLYYDAGSGWQEVMMTGGTTYTATLPGQPHGTVVNYYIEATDNNDVTGTYPMNAPEEYMTTGFMTAGLDYNVLTLTFEEGSGAPVDHSGFNAVVTSPRPFNYSTDAAEGTYSFLMNPETPGMLENNTMAQGEDSSFLRIHSPFISSENFNVDFWFKADSLEEYIRIINLPRAPEDYAYNNFQIRTQPGDYTAGWPLSARYYTSSEAAHPNSWVSLTTSTTINVDSWYRVVFKRHSAEAVFELYDNTNTLIESVSTDTIANEPPILTSYPLRIGNGGNVAGTKGLDGLIDYVRIYNNFAGVVPVELTSFSATVADNVVELNWQTATETNNLGFEIQRGTEINNIRTIGYLEGNGTTTEPVSYSYTDNEVSNGSYYYRLRQIDFDGASSFSDIVYVEVDNVPDDFTLMQNYPNPFNPATTIKYGLPETSDVKVTVFNAIGQVVKEVVSEVQQAGYYEVDFDASSLSSGIYYYTITAQTLDGSQAFKEAKKMMLLK